MNKELLLYLFLAVDLFLVYAVSKIVNKQLKLPEWKLIVYSLTVVPVGLFCSKLMRLVEAGTWEGSSFYGAVLFEPIIMVFIGILISIRPLEMFDLGAASACVSLIFLKIHCKIKDCCYGKILRYEPNGRPIRFPSQIVEMINGIVILAAILYIVKQKKEKGFAYAWFLLLYGISRFVLNLFRETEPFILGLSAGCFWSVIAIAIGGMILIIKRKRYYEENGK